MALPTQQLLRQGPVLAALGGTVMRAMWSLAHAGRTSSGAAPATEYPGPLLTATLPPRPRALVNDYVRRMGGDPAWYRDTVPAHLFPQWTFPLAARALGALPYPMWRVVNAGCRLEQHAPLPSNKPLQLSARIESLDDDGRRVLIAQRLVTGTDEHPEAVVAHVFAFVPKAAPRAPSGDATQRAKKAPPTVPVDARELAFWSLRAQAGLEYAMLTGDVNPVHWLPRYARAFGFRSAILHGFATLARAVEGLNRAQLCGDASALRRLDVRFTTPLALPARAGLYVRGQQLWVAPALGGAAYLEGTFETRPAGGTHHG